MDYSCLFAIRSLGGNQIPDKYRVVPPFFIIMKKILFIISFIVPLLGYSQEYADFKLQFDGTFKTIDGKEFIVVEKEGKSASELYNEILQSVTLQYNSAKDVISKVDNSVISINGISTDCVTLSSMFGVKVRFSIQYILQFQFKDGKIRVEAPVLSRLFTDRALDIKPISGWLNAQSIFKKDKPNPKKQSTIDDFENTLNGLINSLLTAKNVESDW